MSRDFMSFKGFLIELTRHRPEMPFVGTLVDSDPLQVFEFKSTDLHGVWSEYFSLVNSCLQNYPNQQNIFTEEFDNPESFVGRRIMQVWAESVSGQICTVKSVSPCTDGRYYLVDTIDQDGKSDRLTLREGQKIRTLKDKKLLFRDLPLGQKFRLCGKYGNPVYVKVSPSQYAEVSIGRSAMFGADLNSEVSLNGIEGDLANA